MAEHLGSTEPKLKNTVSSKPFLLTSDVNYGHQNEGFIDAAGASDLLFLDMIKSEGKRQHSGGRDN